MANVIPLFKMENKQFKTNYCPVSLSVSLSKVFNRVYEFLEVTGFFYRFQSGFRPGDSTVSQLVYIIHKIYQAFKKGHELRAVFLDISKAFDKVWHRGLLAKLQSIGINGPLFQWFESYLLDRCQRVTLKGKILIGQGLRQGSLKGLF
jgi:hypothetical protein